MDITAAVVFTEIVPGLNCKRVKRCLLVGLAAASGVVLLSSAATGAAPENFWAALEKAGNLPKFEIQHPLEGARMPANMPSPVVFWRTNDSKATSWSVGVTAGGKRWSYEGIQPMWKPPEADWKNVKEAAAGQSIEFVVASATRTNENRSALTSVASSKFTVEPDAVTVPLFFREVNLPFVEAVKDPSKIRWRFGGLDKGQPPPIVLEHMPVCGNCHSFSSKGDYLAMDVDYANSKASYVITKTAPEMVLATSDIITWDDFRREDGQQTFGLLSQISPDGRHVLSTVKDRSVFVPRNDLAFSQLFFPLKGILAVYDRDEKTFSSLPGADDPQFVQSNPSWSPDGKWVVFARNKAADLVQASDRSRVLLTPEECEDFLKRGKEFRFDLYRLPFNDGKGGTPEPLKGASKNGRSNYFPKYSPDGKWIVFCQASNYMLLQPDSELFIIPSEGGEARRLGSNLSRMNSWHSWTPDGKWLVFTSKAHSDYTQLYLTRMGEDATASPPVWLAHMVDPGRAANIPEFVDLPPDYIVKIKEQFLDDYSYTRAGNEFFRAGDADNAIARFQTALSMNPNNAMAHQRLGFLLYRAKHQPAEALQHTQAAIRLEPRNPFARFDLGFALFERKDFSNAIPHLAEAARLLPKGFDRVYNATDINYLLGEANYRLERFGEAVPPLLEVIARTTNHARASFLVAMSKAWLGETDASSEFYKQAIAAQPEMARLPDYYDLLSRNYLNKGDKANALIFAEKAHSLAVAAGRTDQAARLQQRLEYCRGNK